MSHEKGLEPFPSPRAFWWA